jgi:hypothetical protein
MSHTASVVKSKEAFNNYFLNMADDLQIPNDNDISPFTDFTSKECLTKWLLTAEYNSCNRRGDIKNNMFPESKR